MATVTMEASEWEAMKDKERLLKESLKKEQELSETIQKLQTEKVIALEAANMRIVKTIRTETYSAVFELQSPSYAWRIIERFVYNTKYGNDSIRELISLLFTTKRTPEILNQEETITYHGLEEIREELREELKRELVKLDEIFVKEANEAILKNKELVTQLEVEKRLAGYSDYWQKSYEKCSVRLNDNKEKLKAIHLTLLDCKRFNKRTTINSIKAILK